MTELFQPLRLLAKVGIAAVFLTACEGSILVPDGSSGSAGPGATGPGSPGGAGNLGGGSAIDPNAAGPRPLSRLTRREYDNTVRDLLEDVSQPARDFPDDRERTFLFRRAGLVATQDADLLRAAAETLAATAMETPSSVLPCDPETGEAECAAEFISVFGQRAYRRPLAPVEVERLTALYENARGPLQLSFNEAIVTLLEAMLQSPAFLYHWESPYEKPLLEGKVVKLGPYDVASRLSYFIWGSMPDDALFEAAASGKLATEADIAAQATRMFAHDKAREAAIAFFGEWLELDLLTQLPKSGEDYPEYDEQLKDAMTSGSDAFAAHVLFDGGGKLETLLTADFSFSNGELSEVYGGSATGTGLSKSMLDTTQRLGLLTQPAFLTLTGSPDGSNPVKRGKAVYEKLLCGVLPPPPPNVPPAKPASAGGTTRERFAEHGENECARGCHVFMDPLGFAFEHYDGIGRYRTMDNGKAVDAASSLTLDGVEKPFANALELVQILASSETVRECFAKQWFRFAVGREDTEGDAASLAAIATAFASSEHDMRSLVPAIAQARSLRYRSLAPGEPSP
ncbi:MAG TPA: DUF1592 domain-containing protein [Polyangiaceae bacterium]|nr:DUF1592 domain-containing protein [Polyangiaceae bacterium]